MFAPKYTKLLAFFMVDGWMSLFLLQSIVQLYNNWFQSSPVAESNHYPSHTATTVNFDRVKRFKATDGDLLLG